jgi:hypothetical protein
MEEVIVTMLIKTYLIAARQLLKTPDIPFDLKVVLNF